MNIKNMENTIRLDSDEILSNKAQGELYNKISSMFISEMDRNKIIYNISNTDSLKNSLLSIKKDVLDKINDIQILKKLWLDYYVFTLEKVGNEYIEEMTKKHSDFCICLCEVNKNGEIKLTATPINDTKLKNKYIDLTTKHITNVNVELKKKFYNFGSKIVEIIYNNNEFKEIINRFEKSNNSKQQNIQSQETPNVSKLSKNISIEPTTYKKLQKLPQDKFHLLIQNLNNEINLFHLYLKNLNNKVYKQSLTGTNSYSRYDEQSNQELSDLKITYKGPVSDIPNTVLFTCNFSDLDDNNSNKIEYSLTCLTNTEDYTTHIYNLSKTVKKDYAVNRKEEENMLKVGPMYDLYHYISPSFDTFDIPYFENNKDGKNIFFKKNGKLYCKDGEILEKKNGTKSFVRVLFEDIDSIYKFEIEKNSSNSHKTKEKLRQAENKFKEDFVRFLILDKKKFSIMTTEEKNGTEFSKEKKIHEPKNDVDALEQFFLYCSKELKQKLESIKTQFRDNNATRTQKALELLEHMRIVDIKQKKSI